MKQLTIIIENRVGALADVCEVLGGVGVNIKSVSAQGEGEMGVIRLITEDERTAKNVLEKSGFKVSVGDVLIARIADKPGELAKVARKLANAGVNIECIYLLTKDKGYGEIAIKPDKMDVALKALKK